MSTSPIGLFGGTFDPIHCGHVAVASFLTQVCPLKEIHFIPCHSPPHRLMPQATPAQRLEMVKLAIAGHKGWIADDIDLQRPGPSYMIDTLEILHRRQARSSWCLILGMDAFLQFEQWREWQRILTLTHLIVINRPNYHLAELSEIQKLLNDRKVGHFSELKKTNSGKILLLNMPPAAISGTQIRQSSAQIPYVLPPAVLNYIKEQGLYKV